MYAYIVFRSLWRAVFGGWRRHPPFYHPVSRVIIVSVFFFNYYSAPAAVQSFLRQTKFNTRADGNTAVFQHCAVDNKRFRVARQPRKSSHLPRVRNLTHPEIKIPEVEDDGIEIEKPPAASERPSVYGSSKIRDLDASLRDKSRSPRGEPLLHIDSPSQ